MADRSQTRVELSRHLGLNNSVILDRCKQLNIKLKPKQPFSAEQLEQFYDFHNFLQNPPHGYNRSIKGYRNYQSDLKAGNTNDPVATRDLQVKSELFNTIVGSLEKAELKAFARALAPVIIRDFLQKSVDHRWAFTTEDTSAFFQRSDLERISTFEPVLGFTVCKIGNDKWVVRSAVRDGEARGLKVVRAYQSAQLSSHRDWSGARLSGAILQGANFKHNNLQGASLSACLLVDAEFEGATLEEAELRFSILSKANCSHAVADGLNADHCTALESNWNHASMNNAQLSQSNFEGSSFVGARLVGANLSGCRLANCNFQNADLTNCDLTGADCSGADLSNANMTGATIANTILDNVKKSSIGNRE